MHIKSFFVAASVASLLAVAAPAHATHQQGNLHWTKPQNSARTIIIIDSTTTPWAPLLPNKVSQWGQPSKIDTNLNSGATDDSTRSSCPQPTNYRRVRVCSYQYNNPNWAGLASVAYNPSNGHIQHGTVKLDGADNGSLTDAGRRHVICQEIGHNLGLAHWNVDGNNSCMNTGHTNDASYDSPASHDIGMVDNITHYHGGSSGNLDTGDPLNGDLVDCVSSVCSILTTHQSHHRVSHNKAIVRYAVNLIVTSPRMTRLVIP